jgi:hypothetical protein
MKLQIVIQKGTAYGVVGDSKLPIINCWVFTEHFNRGIGTFKENEPIEWPKGFAKVIGTTTNGYELEP